MEYTTLGKTGLRVSRLGFGCMRLPMKSAREVDRSLAIPLLHRAVELGITYFDTAVGYCGGDSQRVLGEAMEGMREKVVLSTKNHHYHKKDKAGWWKNLEDSLERLRTDHIDVYNFHGMNWERFEAAVDGEDGLYREALKAKEQGMIDHICHSFHGSLESLKKCIATGLFESVTVQYNLLDRSMEEGIAAAASSGMGVVIMGPVGGGRLGYPSETVAELAGEVKSTPELALRFVLSNPNVSVALSGMSTMEQLEENARTVSETGALTPEDHARLDEAIAERKKLAGLYCTGCDYCMPCPYGVDIPANFEILNIHRVFGLTEHARTRYVSLVGKADLCTLCGRCIPLCPQNLDIPARLAEAVLALDERAGTVRSFLYVTGGKSGDGGALDLELRAGVKNFTEQSYTDTTLTLSGSAGNTVSPESIRIGELGPFARKQRKASVRLPGPMHLMSVDVCATTVRDGAAGGESEHNSHIVVCAPAGEAWSGDADTGEGRRSADRIHVPEVWHPRPEAQSEAAAWSSHSFDFALRYDEQRLFLWSAVRDDLERPLETMPAEGKVAGRTAADHLMLFVDARRREHRGRGGHADGVLWARLFPVQGCEEVAVQSRPDAPIEAKIQPAAHGGCGPAGSHGGYLVECAIPWSALSVEAPPAVVGFDLVLVSHDQQGNEAVRMSWSGRRGQERSTTGWPLVVLLPRDS